MTQAELLPGTLDLLILLILANFSTAEDIASVKITLSRTGCPAPG
jgi:hypothetical protein